MYVHSLILAGDPDPNPNILDGTIRTSVTVFLMDLALPDSFTRWEAVTRNAPFTPPPPTPTPPVQIHPSVEQRTLNPLKGPKQEAPGRHHLHHEMTTPLPQQREGATSTTSLSTAKEGDRQVVTDGTLATFVGAFF